MAKDFENTVIDQNTTKTIAIDSSHWKDILSKKKEEDQPQAEAGAFFLSFGDDPVPVILPAIV